MRNRNYGWYAVAAAVAVVGALWVGVPLATLGVAAVVLACPLMMLFMMRGMQGMHDDGKQTRGQGGQRDQDRDRSPRRP